MPSGGLELEASFWDGDKPNGKARPRVMREGGKRRFGGAERCLFRGPSILRVLSR